MAINLLNIEEYIIQRVKEVAPDVNTEPGSGVRDLLVTPLVTILQPVANEIHRIKKSQSLLNAESLSDEDIDAILANIFIDREVGSKASGTAYLIVVNPVVLSVPAGTVLFAKGGLKFYTTTAIIRGPEAFTLNIITGRYEVPVPVEAAEKGSEYNINIGEITGIILTDPNIIGATNKTAFTGGAEKESSTTLLDRARNSLGSRDLSTKRGAIDILTNAFKEVINVNVVGFGDEDMIRDLIHYPDITIDGITYPEAEGVHLGGKIDIYAQVGIETKTVTCPNLTNTISGENNFGFNKIAFYTAGSDPNILYEGTGECGTTVKPIVDIKGVSIDDASIAAVPELANASLIEERDYVFISQSPGLSNSMDDRKELRFVRGTGEVENLSINNLYVETPEGGVYYPLDTHELGVALETPDIREGRNLQLLGVSVEEVSSYGLFNHGQGTVDGSRSFRVLPSQGQLEIELGEQTLMTRVLHLTTGIGSSLTSDIYNTNYGEFTLMGWYNLSSLPGPTEKRTLFNTFVDIGDGIQNKEHVLHIYVDSEGKIVFNTRSTEGFFSQENLTERAIMLDFVNIDNSEDNWVFLAFTYDPPAQKKSIYYAGISDTELKEAVLDIPSYSISKIDADYPDAEMLIGTSGDQENNANESFDGLIDGLQIYFSSLSMAYIETIRKNQNTATIHGVEKSSILDALATLIAENPDDNIIAGGRLLMTTGAAAGSEFVITSASSYFGSGGPLTMTIVGTGSTPVTKIKNGDRYALTPYPLNVGTLGARTTSVTGEIINASGGVSDNGEILIGVGITALYDAGLKIQDIQDYVDLNDTRPANADIIAKHVFPIYVGGSVNISTNAIITAEELAVEVNNYIHSIPVGGTFSVASLVNYMFDVGIQGLRLPLNAITFTSRNIQFRRSVVTGVEDEITAGKSQYFIPDGITVNIV